MHFLVFQHASVEHPGIFRDFWREAGVTWTAVELDEGENIPSQLAGFDAMVVMGGPMDTWQTDKHPWLIPEVEAIRSFVCDLGRPFLGVCLGHQLLAEATGGKVGLALSSEVGPCRVDLTAACASDRLFEGLPSPLTTFQWHSAEVRSLPSNSVVLARTDACGVQAFRFGDRAWGLQFHAEVTSETVDDWGRIPEYATSLEDVLGPSAGERLAYETLELLPEFARTARHFSDRFLNCVKELRANPNTRERA